VTGTPPLPLEFHGIPMTGSAAGSFDLEVQPNQTVVVVGDENSGVDGLAEIALGLEKTVAGSVRVLGTEIGGLSRREQLAFRRRLGYLPAGDGLLSNLTLRDNIRLPLRFGSNFKPDEIEGRVDVILALLRLTRAAEVRPAQANEEQRRRAALGRALAFDPELVLLEQPFVGLTDRVSAELLEIARGGETAAGARRTVFITGQDIPMLLRTRVERVVPIADSRRMPSKV
jgi:ABC-type transporter Mla maintaining outer membrane lipid asymmetry ATPase subunit MlaF